MANVLKRGVSKVYSRLNALVYGRRSGFKYGPVDDLEGMTPMSFYPPYVLEGDPQMRVKGLTQSGDGGFNTGLWDCTGGRFLWHFQCDEVVHILKGAVTVKVDNEVKRLEPGMVAFFPIGTVSEWQVHDYVLKLFAHHHPTPTFKKWLGA